jgi:DNA-binding CsgD family transcriptional regulator
MDAAVEFRLQGTVCRVIPESGAELSGSLGSGYRGGVPDGEPDPQVVGSCLLDGRRYVIVRDGNGSGAEPPAGRGRVADLLTSREAQVAMMVAEGLSNKRIAARLGLSEWTVTTYLRRIFAKLGVRTRAAMVARILSELRV